MQSAEENQVTLYTPKPFWNPTVILFVLIPFIVLGTTTLNMGFITEIKDIIIILAIFILIILAVLFFTEPQGEVSVSKEKGFLRYTRKIKRLRNTG